MAAIAPSKRNARIRVEAIPDELHARLSLYSQSHFYSKLMDALYYCAAIGLSVLEAADGVTLIKVNDSLHGKSGEGNRGDRL